MKNLTKFNEQIGFKNEVSEKSVIVFMRKVWVANKIDINILPKDEIISETKKYNGFDSLVRLLELSGINDLSDDFIIENGILLHNEF